MSLSKALSKEYFKFENEYRKQYGDKMVVLMAIGSFYDILEMVCDVPTGPGPLEQVASLLNITVGGKNKGTELPYFVGFPKVAISKYLPLLIDDGYTVVVVDENKISHSGKEIIKRKVTGVYSSSVYPMHIVDTPKDNSLMSVIIEVYETGALYSICNLNTFTNEFHIYEKSTEVQKSSKGIMRSIPSILDDVMRIMVRYPVTEMMFFVAQSAVESQSVDKEYICDYLDLFDKTVYVENICMQESGKENYKRYQDINFQHSFLKKAYSHINFGVLDPVTYMDLERHPLSVMNCIRVLEFVSRHDEKYLENICLPKYIDEYNHLVLEMNTVQQLNILSTKNSHRFGSLFQVINKTSTAIGKRGLKSLLCKPFRNKSEIEKRFVMADELERLTRNESGKIEKLLDKVCDFEKLHRKMSLQLLHPYEFCNLHNSYKTIIELAQELQQTSLCLDKEVFSKLQSYISSYTMVFDVEAMQKYSLNETFSSSCNQMQKSFFHTGVVKELDTIQIKIADIEDQVESIRRSYEEKIRQGNNSGGDWIKTTYTDQDGYFFSCTKIRTKLLQDQLAKHDKDTENSLIIIKNNTSACKLTNTKLKKLSLDLVNQRELFIRKIKLHYVEHIRELISKYGCIFDDLREFVENIDIIKSNIKCKDAYNYCKPQLLEHSGGESMVCATEMRHPIIERVNQQVEYIPNDIDLTKQNKGMVLYALNSCGKSSLLRSIGLCVVMAQCGLHVPCKTFKLAPFHSIVTQVDLYDNLWKAQSSFVSEMIGLKKIMKLADEKCLVLSDELTKGTEVISATSIFASSVLNLIQKKCKFVFTTHLQDVAKLDEIKECNELSICHLSVDVELDGTIVFERKLKTGPCSELYGLEVAKAVGLESQLMDLSFTIRNKLVNQKSLGSASTLKRSRYNSKKTLEKCEICGYAPQKKTDMPLDTHHINFQCNADEKGFNGHFHKNSQFNLVCLCKICHVKVHNNEISITGYIDTTKGKRLEYNHKPTEN